MSVPRMIKDKCTSWTAASPQILYLLFQKNTYVFIVCNVFLITLFLLPSLEILLKHFGFYV